MEQPDTVLRIYMSFLIFVLVKSRSDIIRYPVEVSVTVNGMIALFLDVIVAQWSCLAVIYFKTLTYCIDIIVATTACLASFKHTADKLVFVDFKTDYSVNLRAVLFQHLGQSLGLRDCTGKTVENHAFSSLFGMIFEKSGQEPLP